MNKIFFYILLIISADSYLNFKAFSNKILNYMFFLNLMSHMSNRQNIHKDNNL